MGVEAGPAGRPSETRSSRVEDEGRRSTPVRRRFTRLWARTTMSVMVGPGQPPSSRRARRPHLAAPRHRDGRRLRATAVEVHVGPVPVQLFSWEMGRNLPVYVGIDDATLARGGVGWDSESAALDEPGQIVLFGHRVAAGAPHDRSAASWAHDHHRRCQRSRLRLRRREHSRDRHPTGTRSWPGRRPTAAASRSWRVTRRGRWSTASSCTPSSSERRNERRQLATQPTAVVLPVAERPHVALQHPPQHSEAVAHHVVVRDDRAAVERGVADLGGQLAHAPSPKPVNWGRGGAAGAAPPSPPPDGPARVRSRSCSRRR